MYLGIDIGTSSVKVVLIDADQRIVASRSEPLEVERPHPNWSEQDPESWVAATSAAIDAICRDHAKALQRVSGIGLSGHMHGATLIDKAGRPLRPCILWNDGRSCEGSGRARRRSALPKDHRQHRLSRLHRAKTRLGAPARAEDFRQGREGAAAEGLCAALADRRPRLRHVGFRRHVMARCREARLVGRAACRDASRARPDAGALRGHRGDRKAPRRARDALGHDARAGRRRRRRRQCGFGLRRRNGRARLGLRFARHVRRDLRLQRKVPPERGERRPRLLPRAAEHLAPDGRDPLRRRVARMAVARHRTRAPARCREAVAKAPPAEEPLFFLPYLSGERTPHNDAGARGSFVGLSHQTTAQRWRAP